MHKLKVNLDDVATAFDWDRSENDEPYLDVETGAVVYAMSEAKRLLDEFEVQDVGSDEDKLERLERWMEREAVPDWQKDTVREAFEIETVGPVRFLWIPERESHQGYDDMVDFTADIEDKQLQGLLWAALDGKGAFRRFKDVLLRFPETREAWFAFREKRERDHIIEWLEDEGIELEE
jgi:hypothetical protein